MSVQVRKMPVEIEGETIWVECVPGGAGGERQVGERKNCLKYFHLLYLDIFAGWWRWSYSFEYGGS